jgi:hypothetical protein
MRLAPVTAPALVLAALVLAACGGTVINDMEAEDYLRGTVEPPPGTRIESVNCPDGVDAERGETFECTLETADGAEAVVPMRVLDERGTVEPAGPVRTE